jgi:hypothetical protein
MINILENPEYFSERNIHFDIIVSVEVWEHFDRKDVNSALRWLSESLANSGILIATTSLWFPFRTDPMLRLNKEWGSGQLDWWHYPHFLDHTSFYTVENLQTLWGRNECTVQFGYFADRRVHRADPFKRIIAVCKQLNTPLASRVSDEVAGKYLDVWYS